MTDQKVDQKTYKERILQHYRTPKNFGELEKPDIFAREDNPLCGDEVALYLELGEDKRVTSARFKGRGCAISLASASMMTEAITGKTLDEIRRIDEQAVLADLGIEISAMRTKCAMLVLHVLRQGIRLHETNRTVAPEEAFVERRKHIRHRWGLVDHVGNTPLVRLASPEWNLKPDVRVFVKLEGYNPGGSTKARSTLWAIRNAIKSNQAPLLPHMTILDAATGGGAIPLALLGASMGFKTRIMMPADTSPHTRAILRSHGAQVSLLVDETETIEHAIAVARATFNRAPGDYCYLDSYDNPAAWKAHYETTGPEIMSQLGGDFTHLVAGIGSGATLVGLARRFREQAPNVKVIGVTTASEADVIEGLRHVPTSGLPKILDETLLDGQRQVGQKDAEKTVRMLSKHEGMLCGTSSGAAVAASLALARELDHGTIVAILPDDGARYLGLPHWDTDY